jgi:hypothetical protein
MKLRPQTTEEKNKSSGGFKERRQQCLDALKNIPTVNIKGKKYSTVNERHKHLLQLLRSFVIHHLLIKQVH